jgi:hypothetical protein
MPRASIASIERLRDPAVEFAPLAHDEPVFAARQGRRTPHVEVVDRAAVLPADFEHVAEAFGGDERDARQFERELPQQRVGRDRTRVRDQRDIIGARRIDRTVGVRTAVTVQQRRERGERAQLGCARRARDLEPHQPSVARGRNQIGKGAADVDANPDAASFAHAFVHLCPAGASASAPTMRTWRRTANRWYPVPIRSGLNRPQLSGPLPTDVVP